MTNSISNKGISYLIAANLGVLSLCVLTCWIDRDQDSGSPTEAQLFCASIGIGQATMLGAYLAIAKLPFLFRLRWFLRLIIVQWFCFTVPFIPEDSRSGPHLPWPWCVMVDQLLVAMAAFLSIGIFRWISGRVVTTESDTKVSQPTQIQILDLFILISLVALVLATTMRYKNEPQGWDGLIYAVFVMIGLYLGSPIGAVVSLFLIGLLSKEKGAVVLALSPLVFVLTLGLGPVMAFYMDEKARMDTLFFSVPGLVLVLANTFVIRGLCYRLCKLPRTGKSESV